MKKFAKSLFSLLLALSLVFSAPAGEFAKKQIAGAVDVTCDVKFSKPAICCDKGDNIDLTKCGVQFSPTSLFKTDVRWYYEGSEVKTVSPDSKGVYPLTATSGNESLTVYVVAKESYEKEYVLYRNDFNEKSDKLRVLDEANGGIVSVSDGKLVLEARSGSDSETIVLLPEFLDSFGDAKIEAGIKMSGASDESKWSALIYRFQNNNSQYFQSYFKYNCNATDGVGIYKNNGSDQIENKNAVSFPAWAKDEYNVCSVELKGTEAFVFVNGHDVVSFANTEFATGGFGISVNGVRALVDYVKITLSGNDDSTKTADVSFAKPAIRADIGDTIDLTNCDVQFEVDTIYTKGADITWKKDGKTITSFTPSEAGVTLLTATYENKTKNIYVVTRNLFDGEYVLYENDFNTAPTDFRVIQGTSAVSYGDGEGNYILDASASEATHVRVLFPKFLDEFGDMKIEAKYKESNQFNNRNWSSLMGRVQNSNYPYMHMSVRYDPSLQNPSNEVYDGVEITHRNESDKWETKITAQCNGKEIGGYNTYAIVMQGNVVYGYINGEKVVLYKSNLYVNGGMGLQAKGLKISVDYVKVTLGESPAEEDTSVKCAISKGRPAIGCNAGQKILLDECDVQFVYGNLTVKGSDIVWRKDGKIITEFSDTSLGKHTLTATHGDTTMNIYVYAKKTTENEFIIYENDFSTAPTNFTVIGDYHYTYQSNGCFYIDSYKSGQQTGIILPTYLDEFGDARMEASIKYTRYTNDTSWGSLMGRIQNRNFPYVQGVIKVNAAASSGNGVEISHMASDRKLEVKNQTSTGAFDSKAFNKVCVDVFCENFTITSNDVGIIACDTTPYYSGAWGFQANGVTMVIDYVKVIFTNNNKNYYLNCEGGYAEVRDLDSGINVEPALITEVKTLEDLEHIRTSSPAVAMFNYDCSSGISRILFEDGELTPAEVLVKIGHSIIPAFRIKDSDDANSLSAFLKQHNKKDAYAVSDSPDVVGIAYSNWKYIRGVVDYSSYSNFDVEKLRYSAVSNGARVIILDESVSKSTVTSLQDSYSCVWLSVSEGKTASVSAINKGAYGIVTPDRVLTEECLKMFYASNTQVRRVNVIGHRGNPSVAQENTIAGANAAYTNGATMVEVDFYRVADGVLMVMHDNKIDSATNGSGSIFDFTSTQLKNYVVDINKDVAPEPVPSLEEYFILAARDPDKKLVVEIKQHKIGNTVYTNYAEELSRLVKKYNITNQMVFIAFNEADLEAVKKVLPGAPTGWLNYFGPDYNVESILEKLQTYNSVSSPSYTDIQLGTNDIRDLMYRGVTVWPWTINNQTLFDTLMLSGVAGITTDYSQWSKDYVETLNADATGKVVAITYGGVSTDVSANVEMVVIEDTLGISFVNGKMNVPQPLNGGKASFYFRYKSHNSSGEAYYTVSEVQTIEVASNDLFQLVDGSKIYVEESIIRDIPANTTIAFVKKQFVNSVIITDFNGEVLANDDFVPTGAKVYSEYDSTQMINIVVKGDINADGELTTTDYLLIKGHCRGSNSLTGLYYDAAECDCSGVVNTSDVIKLKAHLMGLDNIYE